MTLALSGTAGLLQNYDYQVLTTGFSYTFSAYNTLVINPAATLDTGTITMPAAPVDGMTVTFSSTKAITTLTVSANTGQTINVPLTTLLAGKSASYIYRAASTAWFPYSDVSTITGYGGPRAVFYTATGPSTFTIPTGVTSIKATVVSGGGGGSGYSTAPCDGQNGGSGGAGNSGVQWFVGLTPGNTLAVVVGIGGSGTNPGNPTSPGGAGGTSSISSGTQTISTFQITGGAAGTYRGNGSIGTQGTVTGISNSGSGVAGFYSQPGGNLQINGVACGTRGVGAGAGVPANGPGSSGTQGAVLIEY